MMRRWEIVHVKFPENNKHLINGNFDHPQLGIKASKYMKTAMPISYHAFPFPCPLEPAFKTWKHISYPFDFSSTYEVTQRIPSCPLNL